MPQLMPLYWSVSVFVIFFIILMMVDYYLHNFFEFVMINNNTNMNSENVVWKW